MYAINIFHFGIVTYEEGFATIEAAKARIAEFAGVVSAEVVDLNDDVVYEIEED